MSKVKKLDIWGPHVLSKDNKNQRVNVYASLLACHPLTCQQHRLFWFQIVTGGENLYIYVNVNNRKKWLNPNRKANLRSNSRKTGKTTSSDFTARPHTVNITEAATQELIGLLFHIHPIRLILHH